MKKFAEWLKTECNEELPDDYVDGLWLLQRGLPLIVSCSGCGTIMTILSAYINKDNMCFCSACAGVKEED